MRYLDELLIVDTIKEVGKVSRKEALKNRKKEASHSYIFIYTFNPYAPNIRKILHKPRSIIQNDKFAKADIIISALKIDRNHRFV